MMANLTGGGGGTGLYRCTGGTSTLHGTGVWVPFGVKNTVNPRGEWTFVVINEGVALDVKIRVPASIGGRNLYRYTYSGEYVPPAAANPAYLLTLGSAVQRRHHLIPRIASPGTASSSTRRSTCRAGVREPRADRNGNGLTRLGFGMPL
jgi:hypothetical protein